LYFQTLNQNKFTMKKLTLSAALLLTSLFFSTNSSAQNRSVQNVLGNLATTAPLGIPNEIFRFRPGFVTNLLNGALPPSPTVGTTGFGAADRWLSFGQINGLNQKIYGYRTQTNGRGLAMGYSTDTFNTVLSNPFIEWIGNGTLNQGTTDPNNNTSSGNLDFNFAQNPTGAASVRKTALTIQPVTPTVGSPQFDAFTYARKNCLIGQLQVGTYGGLGSADKWVGIGNVNTPSGPSYIGTRVQSNAGSLLTGVDADVPFVQFKLPNGSIIGGTIPKGLEFRGESGSGVITNVMKMDEQGRIVTGTNPSGQALDINLVNYNMFVSGRTENTSLTARFNVGLYARPSRNFLIDASTTREVAVFGEAFPDGTGSFPGAAGGNIAIYGNLVGQPGANDYAGFFNGQVFTTESYQGSDRRLKKDIKQEENILEKIMQLKPVSYVYDRAATKTLNFEFDKTSHGFIADELNEVFPEMIGQFKELDFKNPKEAKTFKSVNYIQLISVLTKGIQELKVQNDELSKKVEALSASNTLVINNSKNLPQDIAESAFTLAQNMPNPFSQKTTINYSTPQNTKQAILGIFDLNGKMIEQYNLVAGKGQVTINGNQLAAGLYIYSIIANGQEVISKRMVLTK
jgi:hypothetical protein